MKVLRPFLLRRLKKEVESQLPEKVRKIINSNYYFMKPRIINLTLDSIQPDSSTLLIINGLCMYKLLLG